MAEFFESMDEVLAELQRQNALPDFANPTVSSGLGAGRGFETENAESSLRKIEQAAKKAHDAGLEASTVWHKVESKLQQQGYRMVIRRSPRGRNEFEIFAVPDNLSKQERQDMKVLTQYPNLVWSGLENGLSSRYGQKTIDQGRLDYLDGALAFYTNATQQAQAILNRLTNPRGGNNTRYNDYAKLARNAKNELERRIAQRHIKSSVANAERHANSGYNAVNSYQTDELWKMMQGTGTARSIAQRKSLVSIQPMVDSILNKEFKQIIQAYTRANPSRQLSNQQFKARAEQDIFHTLYWYLQNRAVDALEKELTEASSKGWNAGYLWKNPEIRKVLQNAGRQLHGLGADVGLTGESSANQMMINLLRHGDIGVFGSLGDKSGRKPMQVAQMRQRQQRAQEALAKALTNPATSGGLYGKRRVYTGWEVAAGLDKLAEEQAQTGVMFATAEEIREAQQALMTREKNKRSAASVGYGSLPHNGGIFYSKALGATLDSHQQRSMSVSMEAFKRAQDKLVDKLLTPETRADTIKSVAKSIKAGAASRAAFTQWMSTFAPDQRIDQQQFWEALEAQEFAAAYSEALQRQTSREILRSQKGIKLSTVGDLARIIERDPMGKDQVTIEWLEKHAMQSGEKLLGGAHFVKGRAKEIEYFQDLVKEIWIKRGKSENTAERLASRIGLMMEPEKLTSRNPDAFLAAFFDEITRALGGAGGSQTLLNSFIESVNQTVDGKKWLEQEGDHWKTNFDRFTRRPDDSDAKIQEALQSYVTQVQRGLADVTEQLTKRAGTLTNDTLKADVNALNDELTMMGQALTIKDGQLKYDPSKFIGATTVGQHHAYDYGDPGRAVLNADYRLIGAISRGILRSNLGGTTSPEYARALLGQRSRNGTPNGQYAWQLDLDANGNIINAGQFGGTAESRRAHEQWVKSLAAVNDVKQWMNTQGGTWTVANWMAKGNQDIVLGHGQLEEFLGAHGIDTGALSKKQLAQLKKRYLDVSGLHDDSFAYKGEYDEGHMSAADFASSFGRIAKLEKANAGRLLFVPLTGGIAGSSLGKQLVTSAIALPRMDALGGAVETILANGNRGYDIPEPLRILPSLINAQDDVHFARTGQLSITPKEASEAFTQAAFENIGRMVASVESKNGSVWQAGNKAKLYHSAIRHATAPDVKGGAWGALGDVATRMNPEDLEAMLSKQDPDQTDAQYLSQLQTQYYYLYSNLVEDPKKLEDMWSAVSSRYKGRAALTKHLAELVTRGSDAFNARAELAQHKNVALHGLAGFGLRYPLSNAEDTRAADIFADSELVSGEVVAALGAGAGQNLDFDGDTYATVLQMLGTSDPAERAKLVAQMVRQNEVDQNLMRRQADAFRADYEKELKSGVSLESIARAEAGEVAAVTSRLNKGFTGRFSNQFQAISEALSLNEPWADRETPMNAEERAAFLQNQVVRAVYESFTQDAISSKKVRERIEDRYGSAWAGNSGYLSEMDKLYELIQGKNTYAGIESIKDLVTLAQDLKILGTDDKGGVFGWRLNSQLLAKMDQFSDDEVAKALGVSTDVVRAWKDPSNQAATLGLTGDQLARLIDTVNTRVKRDTGSDIGAVIRDKMNRAGGIDATSNPIYRVGTNTGTEAQYERVKETNAALAEAGAQAGAFGEALKKATTALDAATDEVKESTATAQKRDDVLGNLEYALKHRATDTPVAVTSLTSSLAGGNFASALDKAAFEEALILAHADNPNAIQSLEGYDAETFKKFRNSLLGSRRGTIADQVEQLVNTYGLDTSQVNSVDDFIKLVEADPNARQDLYEYNPSEHAIGLGVLLGRGDESVYGKDSDALKAAQRNRALQEALFGTENVDADQWSQLVKGFNLAEALRRMAYNVGGQIIGHEFGVVGGNGAGNAPGWNHGRIDLLMKSVGTRSDGSTYNILDVFDKKSVPSLSQLDKYGPGLNYLAQVAVYAENLRQLQAYINKHEIKTLGQLKNNKEYYQDAWLAKGGREIDDEMFALLSDPHTLIRAALTYVDDYGNVRNYDVGSGLGDGALMQRLANYAMHGIPEAKWEPGDAETVRRQIARINNRGVAFGGHGGGGGGPVIPIAGGDSGANHTGGGGLSGLLGRQLSMYFGRILGGTGLYRLFAKVRQGITSLVKEATELDKTLTNLQITTGGTREDTRQLLSTYAQLGRQLGATTQEVAASALEWQRQGYEAGEVADLVTSSLYLSKLGMIDASTATQNLTSALKGFKIAASESMDVVDKLTAIDLKAATSAGEIANGLAQFANIGSLSGVNIDEAAAYVATIADVTQMSGSSAGQALKTIISRYGNVKAGAFNKLTLDADTGDGTTLNDVERVLSKLGISIRDSNLSFKDFSTILEEIAARWQSLDNVSQRAIANAFAGVRQQEAFTTLLQNWDKYQELLETSQRSKGTASTKYSAYQQSLQAAQSARKTTWEQLANNADISELLIAINKAGEWLGKLVPWLLEHGTQIMISLGQILELFGRGPLTQGLKYFQEQGLLKERAMTREKHKQHKLEQQSTAEDRKQTNLEQQQTNSASTSSKGSKTNAMSNASIAMIGASYALGQIASGITAYQTGGLTHSFTQANGESVTVNSSRRAKEAGRATAALWSAAIPLVGSWIGSYQAEKIAARIDKKRDEANEITRVAQENLKVLSATNNNLVTMVHLRNAATAAEEAERDAATAEYLATIYKSENAAVRDLLTQQLTRIDDKLGSIRSVTEAMHTGTERDRARASHALELAQLQVTHAQDRQSRAAENYAAQEELREAYLQYNMSREGYTQYGTTAASDAQNKATALESGMLTGGAVFGGSAVTMLGTAAAASASVPVYGWIAAVLLAIGAGIAGYFVKYNGETAKSEVAEGWNQYWSFKDTWDELGLDNKIKLLTDTEAELYRSMDEGNDAAAAQLEATRELRKSFESYRDQLRLQEDADNKARMDEALLYAGWQADTTFNTGAGDIRTTKYFLKDLNLTQAKNYGQEALYAALAAALGEEGLSGTTIKVGDRYTEYFTTYARRIMSENEAVGSVLSGEAYTLNEALDKLGAKSDQFSQAIMQDFARAMRVANDELGQYTELLGELTLAELLMSTGELEEEFDNWSGLLGKVADSTQSVTKWMTDIVEHYPDLINYMSNTPVLIQKIVDKLMDLNNQTMRQQYEEYGTSEPFWEKTVKPGAQAWLDAQVEAENITAEQREAVLELVRDKNLTRLNEALTKIGAMAGLDENSELYTTYDLMRQAVTAGTSGVTLRSDIWTEQTQKLTNFIAEQLRTQIAALEAQKEALQDVNKQRQFEVDLLNARNKLSDALNQKQRVYRTGVGFVYEPDQGAIKKAQEELKEVQLQKDVSKITKQIDTLSSEAKQWETWWSRRTQELEENVFADIWGGKNLENFKSSLFGNQNTLLNVTGNGLKVDAASMTNQLTTLFGTEGTFTNSLQTLIWGMDTAPTWFSQTFATSLAPLSTYFTKLNEDQARNNQQLLADVEAAYKTYKEMAWERGQGHAVDTDLWNATLQNYQDVFNKAVSAGAITEDWAFDKKYYFGQRDHSKGSAYEYLYNPYYLGTHADTLDALKYTAEPVTSKVGEPFKQEYAVQIGSNTKRQLQTGSDGTAWTWAPVEMTDYAAIDAGISTGLTGDLRNALASPAGKKAKAWYWTPETLNSYGGELSSGMADTKLKGILQSSSDWASVAQKLAAQDYPELLIWTPDYGYVLLSGGQAYMASYKTSSNEERERKIASYAEILNHYWRNYSDSDSLLKIPFFEMGTSDLEFMEANWPQITALLKAPSGKIDKWASQLHPSAYASGSFGLGSLGSELVNELGTEAIVTPAGTITALPSHTGIVPADITRNLWQLGEVAPSILRVAEAIAPSSFLSGSNRSAITDQSFNINNLSMSVNADDSFDVDAFIEAIKSRVALTHHAHR